MVGGVFHYHRSRLRCIKGKQQSRDAAQRIQEYSVYSVYIPLIKKLRGCLPGGKSSGTPDVSAEPPRQKAPIETHGIKSYRVQSLFTCSDQLHQG